MRVTLAALAALALSQASGSVRGIVVNVTTGQPVAKAAVMLLRPDALRDAVIATTDDRGRFTIPGIAPATYRVRAERDNYVRSELATVDVASGMAAEVTLSLTPTAMISGRVTDELGDPAPRVYVRAWTTRVVAETRTNDLGEYRLFGLPPDVYVVSAERYAGPAIQGNAVHTPTPPCPDCPGEGVMRVTLPPILIAGGFIDPRALSHETYPPVFYPGTTERKTASPVKAGPGARIEGIDLRLVAR